MRAPALIVLCCACAGSLLAGAVSSSAAGRPASTRFVSSQYGYALPLPAGWGGSRATMPFPGGDIDHTASYADSFTAPDQRIVFALGRRTSAPLVAFTRSHGAWLTANRPCRGLATRAATLAGVPARVATFTCEGGVYGRTYVVKWVVVRRGRGLIFTQFTPEGRRAVDRAILARLLRGLAWTT